MHKKRTAFAIAALALPVLLGGCAALYQRHPVGNRRVPEPTKPVDLSRYLGLWYEIARYEQPFERDCENVTAVYSTGPNGQISIVNSCRKSGRNHDASARAYVVRNSRNTKLKVSFFGPFFVGNYWILDHADNYGWAIVGDPSGRYLWLLDRQQKPSAEEREMLANRALALGYDITLLRWTKQF